MNPIWDEEQQAQHEDELMLQHAIEEEIKMDRCSCKFVKVGEAMDQSNCQVHSKQAKYACCSCKCEDYRPSAVKIMGKGPWPKCVCGHLAQDHN